MYRLVIALIGAIALSGTALAQQAVRPPENLLMPPYAILGVPTGSIATDFARAVQPAFASRPGIVGAFLCWVRYGDEPQPALALLIVSRHDPALMEAVGAVFSGMSGPEDSIDMIFIEPVEADELRIPPIYSKTEAGP